MQPKLYVFYTDNDGQYRCSSIRKNKELVNIACDKTYWPVLVHVTFDAPLASTVDFTQRARFSPDGAESSST